MQLDFNNQNNPEAPIDEVAEQPESTTTPQEVSPDQIDMGINPQLAQIISEAKYRLRRQQEEIDLQPFVKSFTAILAIVSSLFTAGMLIMISIASISWTAPEVPIYYNSAVGTWQNGDKLLLIIATGAYILLTSALMRFVQQVYEFDRRLASLASLILVLFNLLLLIAILQLIFLVT